MNNIRGMMTTGALSQSPPDYDRAAGQDMAAILPPGRKSLLERGLMTRASRIRSRNIAALQQRFPLGGRRQHRHTTPDLRRSVSMVRELQLLTVCSVFAFLGAIVMGVF
jgi:hypothetical protein